ncbi:cell division protein Fic [Alphaproteobacteria bacterium]|nr:cell division protein Fic [Alphaproteobacteria bacterium]
MEYPDKSQLFKRLLTASREQELLATEIATLGGQWTGGANLSQQILDHLKKSSLVTSAGSSARIEGSRLSDEEIRAMIGGLKWEKMKDRDTQEVKGYYELLSFIYDNYQSIELSENIIKEFHARLLEYSEKDERHKGQYKKLENNVQMKNANGETVAVLFETSTALETPTQMTELVDWYNEAIVDPKYHKIIVIAAFIVQFLKIHPFQDGNGRLSRILTDLLLMKADYEYMPYVSLEKIVEEHKADYYIALRASQLTFGSHHESIADWVAFFLKICRAQAATALDLLSTARLEQHLSEKQRIVWGYFKEHADDEISLGLLGQNTTVNYETIRQSLDKLLTLKLIDRFGAGRSTYYKVNKDKVDK